MNKHFLSILLTFFSLQLFAQGTIKGVVKDNTTGETVIGASVMVGEGKGVTTDLDGKYTLSVEDGEYTVTISYVGFESQKFKVKIAGNSVVVNASLETRVLKEVVIQADVARTRETPVAFSTINPIKLQEELGSRDLPMILNSTPGVYATEQGGGSGDSRITLRGFSQENMAVLVDGVPVNDMENGAVFWSNWDGLGDITRSVQVQRGLGASKLAVASVGGTMNTITRGIDGKMQGSLRQEFGNNNYRKTALSYNSGLINNRFGFTLALSSKQGDGWVDGTWTEAYSYFFKGQVRLGKHLVSAGINGAPQKHGQRSFKLSIAEYDKETAEKLNCNVDSFYSPTSLGKFPRGLRYNQHWGEYDDVDLNHVVKNERVNYFHKPLMSINDSWNVNRRLYITTVAYLSIGKGGGTSNVGGITNDAPNGEINFQSIYNSNLNKESKVILGSNTNNHNWYGLLSTANYQLNDKINIMLGIDLRNYTGYHYRKVYDLIGGNYFIDGADQNQSIANNQKVVGDKIAFNYEGHVKWKGIFGQVEYKLDKLSVFITLSGSQSKFKRVDKFLRKDLVIDGQIFPTMVGYGETFFYNGELSTKATEGAIIRTSNDTTYITNNIPFIGLSDSYIVGAKSYTIDSPEARYSETPEKTFYNYTVKGGANYNLNDHQNAYLNVGYLNIAPRFNNVFETSGNRIAYNTDDQKVLGIELGYGIKYNSFSAILNIYRTQWKNKPADASVQIPISDEETINYRLNKINALHKGIELETNFKIIPQKLDWENAFSLGDWRYKSDDSVTIYDEVTGRALRTIYYYSKNVHVGNAAQLQYSTSLKYQLFKDLYVKARFTFFGKNYASFRPDLLDEAHANMESWKMPNYGLFDAFTGYEVKGQKSIRYSFSLGVTNVLNTKYISDAQNGLGYDANSALVFFGVGRKYVASIKLSF
ncbi:MAG: TonB-dependent receptor [Bacteroidetes bacterium]|nr:TonB-dependent receptor [Bacteroidota bacterium]